MCGLLGLARSTYCGRKRRSVPDDPWRELRVAVGSPWLAYDCRLGARVAHVKPVLPEGIRRLGRGKRRWAVVQPHRQPPRNAVAEPFSLR